jgi:hypothetical protein
VNVVVLTKIRHVGFDKIGLSVDDLVDRMAAVIPDPHVAVLDEAIGPFYDTAGIAKWIGRSRQLVHRAVGKKYLALKTSDGELLYPSFQFLPTGDTIPGLFDVVHALEPAMENPWTIAYWLNTERENFGGKSAAEYLRNGKTEPVLAYARQSAAGLLR